MEEAERDLVVEDWAMALKHIPLDAVRKARMTWLVDIKRGHRAPKIAEFLALCPGGMRPVTGSLGIPPAGLTRPTKLPYGQQTPAEKWSYHARMHAFFDATGRTKPRPIDAAMAYYDGDLVGMATAEAQLNGKAAAWAHMRSGEERSGIAGTGVVEVA